MEVKKKIVPYFLFVFPILMLITLLILNRSEELPDYNNYKLYFDNHAHLQGVEYSFILISTIFYKYSNGFVILLFIYAFLGFFLKITYIYNMLVEKIGYFVFIILFVTYLNCFLIVWDFVQIRYSVGIFFLIVAFFSENKKISKISMFLSIFFHYSMILPISIYFIFKILKRKIYKIIIVPVIFSVALIFLMNSKYGLIYSKQEYNIDGIPLLSVRFFLLIIMFFIFSYFKNNISIDYREKVFNISLVALSMTFLVVFLNSTYPAISDRLLDMVNFLMILCLMFTCTTKKAILIIFLYFIVYNLWFLKINILNPDSLIFILI